MGKRITVRPSALAVWVCFAVFEPTIHTALLFLVMALHECGHLLALKLCGAKVVRMTVSAFGAEIRYRMPFGSVLGRTAVALGGVLLNLLCGGVFLFFWKDPLCLYVSVASFVLAFLNLLPVKGLDGGRALEEVLSHFAELDTVDTVVRRSSYVCLILLLVLSVLVLMESGFNFSLLLFTLYLSLSLYR